ncbi:PLDc N-terminal domain-containing protein [Leptospira borgpetersenii]|uniref:Phospholipase D-nuclease N-terminal domain protein n=3 Tax=Leptospira borgpetersenii TaxID=174 RepID=M3FAY3_LEPBO|nr:PLDc N-terminal domain-containing protein [Leptospira borgpetersenii]EMF99032.1 phospholipase D-nuclease N-terminal domain protein [Leptospira borgpetersenii str. 200701203]AXX16288.1 phospholipase [Leptospira borgpetersenii serovar Ceylonica]EKP15076.1 phospholipase D-nuclease N-terminal domain protein [Leptospira borgpetersenii str. 200801926]EKQ90375.1 phospholipase D-nuclease N-terminal domain protein [Leptospira borgpetersenii str. UI 09149]EMN57935.1 phospholipase D-nuclease N-termina
MEQAVVGGPGFFALLFNFYGYYFPFILYTLLAPLALVDLVKREDVDSKIGSIWTGVILLVPVIGAGAYLVVGGSKVPAWLKNTLVYGGVGFLALIILITSVAKF